MDILKWFIQNFPLYVNKMRECSYHYDKNRLNLHHLEGDVWSHTILSYQNTIKFKTTKYIQWAVLLHDLGRVFTQERNKEKKQLSFGDFEGVSCYVCLEVLNKTDLKNEEKIRILKIISYHYEMIDHIKFNNPTFSELLNKFRYEEELLKDLAIYVKCDLNGRIIDDSRKHLYDMTRIDKLILDLNNIKKNQKDVSNENNSLYILVGPPCSGKSTWMENYTSKCIVINRDSCVLEVGRKYSKYNYDEAFDLMKENKEVKKEIDTLDNSREKYAKESIKIDVIIDNPNLKIKNRKEWTDIFKDTHNVIVVIFLIEFETLINRNQSRKNLQNKSISKNGMIRKLKTFHFPLKEEGFDEIQYILT